MFSEVLIQVTVDGEFGKRSPPARQIFQTSAFHLMPTQIIMQAAEVDRRLARAGSLSSGSESSSSSDSEGKSGRRLRSAVVAPPTNCKRQRPRRSEGEEGEWVEGGEAPPPPKKKKEEIDPILTRTGVTMETVLDLSLGDEEQK